MRPRVAVSHLCALKRKLGMCGAAETPSRIENIMTPKGILAPKSFAQNVEDRVFFCVAPFQTPTMPGKKKCSKGKQFHKLSNQCRTPCKKSHGKNFRRSPKGPYYKCIAAKTSARPHCPKGYLRDRKSGTCRSKMKRLK